MNLCSDRELVFNTYTIRYMVSAGTCARPGALERDRDPTLINFTLQMLAGTWAGIWRECAPADPL